MKSHGARLLIASILLIATVQTFAQTKKYDVKSGIVTYDITVVIGQTKLGSRAIVYFDDYGMKERKETYNGDKLSHYIISDGKTLYRILPSQKKAIKIGNAFSGTEVRYDWEEASSKSEKERNAKKLANMTIAGKNCEVFQTTQKETICTFAGWNHILLSFESGGGSSKSLTRAVKVEENVPVPAEKFVVPQGYTVQE
jgi:hypothetical protein